MNTLISSKPYSFPLRADFSPANTALMSIDFQGDFCRPGGYMDAIGLSPETLSRPLANAKRLLERGRALGMTIVHTREGYAPDLSDAPPNRLWRGEHGDQPGIGDEGLLGRYMIRGESGWQIVTEVAPLDGEKVFDKPSYGAFSSTDADGYLRGKGIGNLIVFGVTSDCCVHQTVQEALDRSYDCLTVSDASAATFESVHDLFMGLIERKGGVFGAVCTTETLLAALPNP